MNQNTSLPKTGTQIHNLRNSSMTPNIPKGNSKNPWPARVVAPFTKADAGSGGKQPQEPSSIDAQRVS